MCGIAGYIGESKKPHVTFQLITKLFEKTETRGVDAAGFWGLENGGTGRILYHKEPSKSSVLVRKDVWKRVGKYKLDLLMTHARAASQGVGEPACNTNNHPFVSTDRTVALCHNGRIHDDDYRFLSRKYQVVSQCDSEILLRIFEASIRYSPDELSKEYPDVVTDLLHPIAGVSDIFSYTNDGHMAVSIGERLPDGSRRLWLFRNYFRPLWLVDMRENLGQIFYFSEPRIWDEAVRECDNAHTLLSGQKMVELVPDQIWLLSIAPGEEINVQRFEVLKENDWLPFMVEGQIKISQRPAPCEVISKIEDEEGDYTGDFDLMQDISTKSRKLRELSRNIELKALELQQHDGLERQTADNTSNSLAGCILGLENILALLSGSEA